MRTGRPQHRPTDIDRHRVVLCTTYGLTPQQTATIVGVHVETLRKHYDDELHLGLAQHLARVTAECTAQIGRRLRDPDR